MSYAVWYEHTEHTSFSAAHRTAECPSMSGAATCTTCGANVSIWCLCLCCSGAAILYSPRPGMGMCGTSVTWYRSCVAASRKSLSTRSGDMTNTRESARDRRWCARRFIVRLTPSTCSQTDAKTITRRSAPYPEAPAPPLPTTSSSFTIGTDPRRRASDDARASESFFSPERVFARAAKDADVSRTHVSSGHTLVSSRIAFRSSRSASALAAASWSNKWHDEYSRARSRSRSPAPAVHW